MKNIKILCYCKITQKIKKLAIKHRKTCSSATALSFKTTSIILVILRKTIIFAHSDAGSTTSGVSFYRSYKIIFVGGNQMRQRSFFDFRLIFAMRKYRYFADMQHFAYLIYKKETCILPSWQHNETSERICEISAGLPQDTKGKLQIQAGRYSSPCNTRTAGQVYNKTGYNQIRRA